MARTSAGVLCFTLALGWCAATANAYSVSVTGPTWALPTSVVYVDVVLDSEGADLYGYLMRLYFDPAVLSVISDTFHPLPVSDSSSFYAYPDGWYITDIAFAGSGAVNQSIATLVFHGMDVPANTIVDIVPVVTSLIGTGAAEFASLTTVNPLSIVMAYVPEPTTAILTALGLLGISCARPRG